MAARRGKVMEVTSVKTVLQKVFEILGVAVDSRLPDQTDLVAVQNAAMQMSVNPNYRDIVIVVVELGSEFSVDTGSYVKRQYLYYPFREAADYRRIVCLKAAYCNGKRIDTIKDCEPLTLQHTRETVMDQSARANRDGLGTPNASLVWGKPGRWVARHTEEHSYMRS